MAVRVLNNCVGDSDRQRVDDCRDMQQPKIVVGRVEPVRVQLSRQRFARRLHDTLSHDLLFNGSRKQNDVFGAIRLHFLRVFELHKQCIAYRDR